MDIADKFNAEAAKHPEGSEARKLLSWAAIEIPDKGKYITEILEESDRIIAEQKRRIEELEYHLRRAVDNAYQTYYATVGILPPLEDEPKKKKSRKA